ncbi:MAG: TraU family protein [Geminicoccaceae bacterium]
MMWFRWVAASFVLIGIVVSQAAAQEADGDDLSEFGSDDCPDADGLGPSLLSNVCFDCIFPIRIAGADLNLGDGIIPARAARAPVCTCGNCVGFTVGMWEPARMVELVRKPSCSPTLNGADLGLENGRERGSKGSVDYDKGDTAFYHSHVFAFPILLFLDFFFDGACIEGGNNLPDFDLLYLSEIDPTWNNDELNSFLYPESLLVANPIALAACLADAAAAEIREALDPLFFCVGSWGHLYPVAGHHLQHTSIPRNTSLLASRTLAQLHRLGLARRTMGDDTVCSALPDPFLPKTQYQWSVFYPIAESQGKHPTGQTTLRWGESRVIPGIGEDFVYLLWRWQDCCQRVVCFPF